jgi:uncharacterized protein with PQ loop repeat
VVSTAAVSFACVAHSIYSIIMISVYADGKYWIANEPVFDFVLILISALALSIGLAILWYKLSRVKQ